MDDFISFQESDDDSEGIIDINDKSQLDSDQMEVEIKQDSTANKIVPSFSINSSKNKQSDILNNFKPCRIQLKSSTTDSAVPAREKFKILKIQSELQDIQTVLKTSETPRQARSNFGVDVSDVDNLLRGRPESNQPTFNSINETEEFSDFKQSNLKIPVHQTEEVLANLERFEQSVSGLLKKPDSDLNTLLSQSDLKTIQNARSQIVNLEVKLIEKEKELNRIKNEQITLKDSIIKTNEKDDQLLDEKLANEETTGLNQEINVLKEENMSLMNDISSLRQQFEEIQSVKSLDQQSEIDFNEIERLKDEKNWLNRRIEELHAQVSQKSHQIERLQTEALEVREEIAKIGENHRTEINALVSRHYDEIVDLEKRVHELGLELVDQAENFNERVDEMVNERENLNNDREEVELLCKIYLKKIHDFETRIEILQGQNNDQHILLDESELIKAQMTELEKKYQFSEKENDSLKKEISILKNTLDNKINKIEKMTQDHKLQLQDKLQQQKQKLEKEKENAVLEQKRTLEGLNSALKNDFDKQVREKEKELKIEHEEMIQKLQNEFEKKSKEMEKNHVLESQQKDEEIKNQKDNALAIEQKFQQELQTALNNMSIILNEAKLKEETFNKKIAEVNQEKENIKLLLVKESFARKKIHNKLIELQGNIRIFCRIRPRIELERKEDNQEIIEFPSTEDIIVKKDDNTSSNFEFDRCFAPASTQKEVFDAVEPIIVSCMDGYNVCIFAYGQTGSGKTFTMEGPENDRGVNYRALSELFRVKTDREADFEYTFTISVLEIYNETIRDLLDCSNTNPDSKKLEIRQSAHGNTVPGLTRVCVSTSQEAEIMMTKGGLNRAVGGHDMNERSSRSHSILTVEITGKSLHHDSEFHSKLHLIDLAGSERLSKTDATGDRLREAQYINRSLSALGDVISSLAMKNTHIPFRNSKLTHLLQDSLSGNSKVLMFVNCSPVLDNVGETLCSLNFAARCRAVELGQAKKNLESNEITRLKQYIKQLENEILTKDTNALAAIPKNESNETQTFYSYMEQTETKVASKKTGVVVSNVTTKQQTTGVSQSTAKTTTAKIQKSTFK